MTALAAPAAIAGTSLSPEVEDPAGDVGTEVPVVGRADPGMDLFLAYFANTSAGDVEIAIHVDGFTEGQTPSPNRWVAEWALGAERSAVWLQTVNGGIGYFFGQVDVAPSINVDGRDEVSFRPNAAITGELRFGNPTIVKMKLPRAVAGIPGGATLNETLALTVDCDAAGKCFVADRGPDQGFGRAFRVAELPAGPSNGSFPTPLPSGPPLEKNGPSGGADVLTALGALVVKQAPVLAVLAFVAAGAALTLRRRGPRIGERVTLEPGKVVFGRYQIDKPLSAGGFGRAVLAKDRLLDRPVVIKELLPEWRRDAELRLALVKEARAAGSLAHPNIVTVYDVARAGEDYFMIMEYVERGSLEALLKARGKLAPAEALRIASEILAGLRAVHERGIIHRDIKPANVLLARDGSAKLSDFGVASRSEDLELTTHRQAGTIAYMPPEQILGDPVDARSDLYAVGALLYRMLVGGRYLPGQTTEEFRRAVLDKEPLLPVAGLPPSLNDLLRKALRKAKEERYQSADEMRRAVLAALR